VDNPQRNFLIAYGISPMSVAPRQASSAVFETQARKFAAVLLHSGTAPAFENAKPQFAAGDFMRART
jgi:hypothetical protein